MYRRDPFQFTLRQMLGAMVWFSLACVVLGWLVRSWLSVSKGETLMVSPWVALAPFAIGALCGAGVGVLNRQVGASAGIGILLTPLITGLVVIAVAILAG